MRLRVEFHTGARELPWRDVLAPGRALAYELLKRGAPALGAALHAKGWGPYRMAPFGYGAPTFRAAQRRRGVYAADGPGVVELGSPLAAVVEGWAAGLRETPVLAWGATAFIVDRVVPVETPSFNSGQAVFRTSTPVVTKATLERDAQGQRPEGTVWRLPGEPEWDVYVQNNLRRKAETLGLDAEVTLERVGWTGPKRSFAVAGAAGGGGKKPGACVEVTVSGPPQTLSAIADWGIGQANAAGMGWIDA